MAKWQETRVEKEFTKTRSENGERRSDPRGSEPRHNPTEEKDSNGRQSGLDLMKTRYGAFSIYLFSPF